MKRVMIATFGVALALASGCSSALSKQAERDLAYLVEMEKQTEEALSMLNMHLAEACAQRAEQLRRQSF